MTNKLFLQPTSWSYDLWWQNKCHTNRSKAKPLTLKEKEKKGGKKERRDCHCLSDSCIQKNAQGIIT